MITKNEVLISKFEKTVLNDLELGDDVEVRLYRARNNLEIYVGGYLKAWVDLMKIENLPALSKCLSELTDTIVQEADK